MNSTFNYTKRQINPQHILPHLFGMVEILVIILLINWDYPFVGHDYRFFIPRLVDTDLFIRLNGLAIQWYTPSFGGGLPAYANPQHMEYSVVQWLAYLLDPWSAILITIAGVSYLGYYFFYRLLAERLQLSWMASALGAMFFIGNGFYIEHMIVGHVGFQLFPLAGLILYILTDPQGNILFKGTIVALIITLMIHQAGFIIAIIILLSFLITFPILYLYKPESLNLKRLLLISLVSVVLALGMASSKLFAISAFMRQFPRYISDVYPVSILQALVGLLAQLFGVMALVPVSLITHTDPELLSGALSNITGAKYGIWELDTSLSPVLLFFLFMGFTKWMANIRKSGKLSPKRDQVSALLILAAGVWIVLEMTLAKGPVYSLTKHLPILKSLHVNARFTASFILPLVILGACQADRLFARQRAALPFYISALLVILTLCFYFFLDADVHSRYLDLRLLTQIEDQIKDGNTFPILKVADVGDLDGFLQNASSLQTYEVLFGYSLEEFKPGIHPGSVFDEEHGYFNMTNPSSLVFPDINNALPFERIKAGDRGNLDAFLTRGRPTWKIPAVQILLNKISLLTLIFSICVLLPGFVPHLFTLEKSAT